MKWEFLDRHAWLPIVLLVLLPVIAHLPLWLFGKSTDPLWILGNVAEFTKGMSGLPWIDPNVGFTSEALGRLSAHDWLHGILPWWNPFTGIGMPLAGELQPSSFFLPFTFLFLLPEGLLWQQICMQIIAGLGTYALLRELGLSRLACLMGGALYGLNGTISWSPGPAAVYCGLAFLPLQFLGVEIARKAAKGPLSVLVFGFSIGWSLLAGFPEPCYIGGLLVLAWALYRFITNREEGWRILRRTALGFLFGLLIALPVLIAFLDYARESDSFGLHNYGEQSLPWAALSSMLMPYIYGPVQENYHSAPLQGIWGFIGGYCGVLIFVPAVAGLLAKTRERGLRWLLAGWVLVSMAKIFGVQPVHSIMNFLPLLRQTQFFRYSQPSWMLALIILAAFGLDAFLEASPRRRYAFAVAFGLVMIGGAFAWPGRAFWARPHSRDLVMFVFLGLAVAWTIAGLLACLGTWTWMRGERRRVTLATLLVIDAAVMFMVPQISGVRKGPVDTAAMDFLREHQGLSRDYALGEPLSPNYSAYFGVASVNHNVLPVPKLWADYVDQRIEPGSIARLAGGVFLPTAYGPGSGERSMSKDPSSILDLDVGYLITNPGWTPVSKQFVPATDSTLGPAISFKETVLTKLVSVRDRFDRVAANSEKPRVERWLAKQILRHIPAEASARGVEAVDTQHIKLLPGEKLDLDLSAPAPVPDDAGITAAAVMVTGSEAGLHAKLNVRLCAAKECSSGERLLSEQKVGGFFEVSLNPTLHAVQGSLLHLTVNYQDGDKPLQFYAVAPIGEQEEHLQGPQGAITDRFLDLTLDYGDPLSGAHRVYADSLMDIWKLQNVAPYFEVTSGGPCTLQSVAREKVMADCTAPATLRRRELYMPGWSASVNGAKKLPVKQDGIFESTTLVAGHNQVSFSFLPPHEGFGIAACFVGLGGLLWQLFLVIRGRFSVPEGI